MAYQTINPYTEKLIKTFDELTDAQLEESWRRPKRPLRMTGV